MREERLIGHVHVDSAQVLILDPGRLTETQYESVVLTDRLGGVADVWIEHESPTAENFLEPVRRSCDGVVIETGADGSFPICVDRDAEGNVVAIHIYL